MTDKKIKHNIGFKDGGPYLSKPNQNNSCNIDTTDKSYNRQEAPKTCIFEIRKKLSYILTAHPFIFKV